MAAVRTPAPGARHRLQRLLAVRAPDAAPARWRVPPDGRAGRRRADGHRAGHAWSRSPTDARPGRRPLRPQAGHRADPARAGRRRPRADPARLRQHPARRAEDLVDERPTALPAAGAGRVGGHRARRRRRPGAGARDAADDGRPDRRGRRLADRARRRRPGTPAPLDDLAALGRGPVRRAGRARSPGCPRRPTDDVGALPGPADRHRRPRRPACDAALGCAGRPGRRRHRRARAPSRRRAGPPGPPPPAAAGTGRRPEPGTGAPGAPTPTDRPGHGAAARRSRPAPATPAPGRAGSASVRRAVPGAVPTCRRPACRRRPPSLPGPVAAGAPLPAAAAGRRWRRGARATAGSPVRPAPAGRPVHARASRRWPTHRRLLTADRARAARPAPLGSGRRAPHGRRLDRREVLVPRLPLRGRRSARPDGADEETRAHVAGAASAAAAEVAPPAAGRART